MRLDQLLRDVEIVRASDLTADVKMPFRMPAQAHPDGVFFKCKARPLNVTALEAVTRGATRVILEEGDLEENALPAGVARIVVANVNRAYATACANFSGNGHRKLTLIGVAGTKGKTTVCHLVDAALRRAGARTAMCSSLVLRHPQGETPAINTTPDPMLLHLFLAEAARQNATHAIVEVSSTGIAEERLHGLQFDAVAFTKMDRDRPGQHAGREREMAARRRLFCDASLHASPSTLCVINGDDPVGSELALSASGRVQTFGLGDVAYSSDESGLRIAFDGDELRLPLFGEHNVSNALAAVALATHVLGSRRAAIDGMTDIQPIPGRLERIPTTLDVQVYVDCARTLESVETVLAAITAISGKRKRVAVVGCSGDSDRRKRPLLARAVAADSDICILTTDNPNHEHPASIIREMIAGLRPAQQKAEVRAILDRTTAIEEAIELAMPGGVVVLLGKGEERFQLIEGKRLPHSDRAVAERVLRQLAARATP